MELIINEISKTYKDKKAVKNISLTITPGIWGLLGANGAGKTTLMRIIAGIMKPSSGQVLYNGIPIEILKDSYRDIFGYLPQEFGFYPEFRVIDYLEYVASLKGLTAKDTKSKINELLETLSLSDIKRKKITKLSGGMKRRVGIAQALLNEPEVLILDEPTSGLDPGERVRFRNLISEFAHNRIVIISTHICSDIEYIASKNVVMKSGELIASGTTEELVHLADNKVWSCDIPINRLKEYENNLLIANLKNTNGEMVSIRYLSENPVTPNSIPQEPHLEDLFLWLFPEASTDADRMFRNHENNNYTETR